MFLQHLRCASRILDAFRASWMRFAHPVALDTGHGIAPLGTRPNRLDRSLPFERGEGGPSSTRSVSAKSAIVTPFQKNGELEARGNGQSGKGQGDTYNIQHATKLQF